MRDPGPQEGVRVRAGEAGAVTDGHREQVARRVSEPLLGHPAGDAAPQRRQGPRTSAGFAVEDVRGLPHHGGVGDHAPPPGVRRRVHLPRHAAVRRDPVPDTAVDAVAPVHGLRPLGDQERHPCPHRTPRSVLGHALASRHEPLAALRPRDSVGQRHEPRSRHLTRRQRAKGGGPRMPHPRPRRPRGRERQEHQAVPHHARRRRQEDQGRSRRGQERARGGGKAGEVLRPDARCEGEDGEDEGTGGGGHRPPAVPRLVPVDCRGRMILILHSSYTRPPRHRPFGDRPDLGRSTEDRTMSVGQPRSR